jgi:hypothetical protein
MSFINNNKNDQPKRKFTHDNVNHFFLFQQNSIQAPAWIIRFCNVSTWQFNANWIWINEFALTKTYFWSELDNAN